MTATAKGSVTQNSPRVTLILVSLVQYTVPFLTTAIVVALPAIGRDLHANAVQLSLIQTSQVLAIVIFLLPVGRFADIHGRKRVFISGASILCISTLAMGFVRSIEALIALRFIQGIGASMIISTSIAILTAVFPPGRRGRAMGIISAMVYLGMATGPSVSGFIVEYFGWRWVFFCLSIVILTALILAVTGLKGEWTSAAGEPFDWIGTIIFMVSLFLIIYGAIELPHMLTARWIVLAGLAGMSLFFIMQWRSDFPILDIHLLIDNLVFTFSNFATFINFASSFSFVFFFSLYLQYAKGFSPKDAGLLLIIQPLVQSALSPIAGRLADSLPPARIATIGMAFCTIGLFFAGMIDAGTSLTLIVMITLVMGVGLGLFSSSNLTAIMESVEPRQIGTASSIAATMRSTGMLAGSTTIALIFSYYMGNQQVTSANIDAFLKSQQASFHLFCAMSLVGTIFSMIKGRLAISFSKKHDGSGQNHGARWQ